VTTTPLPDDLTDEERAVIEAVQHNFELYNAARLDPTNQSLRSSAAATMVGPALDRFEEIMDEYVALGRLEKVFIEAPSQMTIDAQSVAVPLISTAASVDACWRNSNQLAEAGTGVVVDDTITSIRETYILQHSDGRWSVSEIITQEVFEGALTCAA
jgi:hypothetical protein